MADTDDKGKQLDLTTMEGVQEAVENIYRELGEMIFQTHGVVPSGYFFGRVNDKGKPLAVPQLRGTPLPGQNLKAIRSVARKAVNHTHAEGCIIVHTVGRRVVFQLEDKKLGDWIWYATPCEKFVLGKLIGPTQLNKFDKDDGFKRLSVIHERYLS